ncbi:Subtilisin-like protease SBT2.5 [Linum grandiflorum]
MLKLTTHTPDFLGIPAGVWPSLGGAESSGDGVVIGLIDTGINPSHPSFAMTTRFNSTTTTKFRGKCISGARFPSSSCNGKIVGARYFARAAIAAGDFNATRDYIHTASTAAGNHQIPVIVNGFNYGNASGMAPGARIAVYKALYTFGGYMSDVVAAVDQAVEDGVDILSLSIGPSSVPPGPSAFLNILEIALLLATKAGVFVVQAAGNGGPASSSILSFSPWITTVAASITDRQYNNTIVLGNGLRFSGTGLAPASDVSNRNTTSAIEVESCQHPEHFIPSLARDKLVICTYNLDFQSQAVSLSTVADTIQKVGAAGFIITMDPTIGSEQVKGTTSTLKAVWEYYNAKTRRWGNGEAMAFMAAARILGGREAFFAGQAPVVASYSSRGPDVNNALLQTADVLKPNIMAPGSSIWAAWSPTSEGDPYIKALIKHKHPKWSPASITSSIMTTAHTTDPHSHSPILSQTANNKLSRATPFDFGSGSVDPARSIDPGLVFNASFDDYLRFLCSVPGVVGNEDSVRRAVGSPCPRRTQRWCSDLNAPSITVSTLVGSRRLVRTVTNVGRFDELYRVTVRRPVGVDVNVAPRSFVVRAYGSVRIGIVLRARNATRRRYVFGEMVLRGSRRHLVRVPIAVYVSRV